MNKQEAEQKIAQLINKAREQLSEAEKIAKENNVARIYHTEYQDGIMVFFNTIYASPSAEEWLPSNC